MGNPRNKNKALRDRQRKRMKAMGLPCALCGRPIDYDLPSRVRVGGRWVWQDWAFELDEIIPVSRWREYGYDSPEACAADPSNHQPTHRICNRNKSNKFIGSKPKKPLNMTKKTPKHSQNW